MLLLKQNDTSKVVQFYMVDATDGYSEETGLTLTVTRSKNGGAFAAVTGTVAEVGNGVYKLTPAAGDVDTLGPCVFRATGTGSRNCVTQCQVVVFDPYDSVRAGLTSLPNASPGAQDGMFIAGANTGNISIAPASGVPLTLTAPSGNSSALVATGYGSGSGIMLMGGATGHGLQAQGGASTGGHGIYATGGGYGYGFRAVGTGASAGINCEGSSGQAGLSCAGNGTGAGISAIGGASGPGIAAGGGVSGGNGIYAYGAAGGHGFYMLGQGAGHGFFAQGGGSDGYGGNFVGGATNGRGLNCSGVGSGSGIRADGGTTGTGLGLFAGSTSGWGLRCSGGAGVGLGLSIAGGASGANAAEIVGSVNGHGLVLTRGATGGGDDLFLTNSDSPTLMAGLLGSQAKLDVNAEVDTALTDIHLDHLLAAAYDPASKPGNASSLFNVMIGNDGGVPQFTANALELGPAGSSLTLTDIEDAVWDALVADHNDTGSFGEAVQSGTPPPGGGTDLTHTTTIIPIEITHKTTVIELE